MESRTKLLIVTVMTVSFVRFYSSGTPFRATSLLLIHAAWENANTVKYYAENSFLHNLDTFDRSTGFARSLSYKIFLPYPQRELYFWLSPSANSAEIFVLVPLLCTMIRVRVIIGLLKSHCSLFAY